MPIATPGYGGGSAGPVSPGGSGPAVSTGAPVAADFGIDWARRFGYLSGPPSPRSVNIVSAGELTLTIGGGAVKVGDVFPEVIGTRLVEGKVLWKRNNGSDGWNVMVSVCAGPINKILAVKLNGAQVPTNAAPIAWTEHLGGYQQAADPIVVATWGTGAVLGGIDYRFPGKAYVMFTLTYPILWENITSFSFLVEGRCDIFDNRAGTTVSRARTSNVATVIVAAAHGLAAGDRAVISGLADAAFNGTHTLVSGTTGSTLKYASTGSNVGTTADTGGKAAWFSDNPALATRWLLTNSVHGLRVPLALVNESSFNTAATACESLGYTLNVVLPGKASGRNYLEAFRGCFQAEVYGEDGLFCCLVDTVRAGAAVIDFVEGVNCKDIEITELPLDQRPTVVKVFYFDAQYGDFPAVPARSEDLGIASGAVAVRDAEYTYEGITNGAQAHKIATYHRKWGSTQPYRFAWKCPFIGIRLQRGMWVTLTTIDTASGQRLNAQAVILDEFQPSDGEWSCVGHEYDVNAYTADSFTADTPLDTGLSNPWDTPPDVTLIYADPTDLGKVYWDVPRNYPAVPTQYGAAFWTNGGFNNYTGSRVNDGLTALKAFDGNTSGTSTLVLDLGAGNDLQMGKVKLWGSALENISQDTLFYWSDDGAAWTYLGAARYGSVLDRTAYPDSVPWTWLIIEWDAPGAHRYWMMEHIRFASAVACDIFDVQFYDFTGEYTGVDHYEVHDTILPTGPIAAIVPATSLPTAASPLDLSAIIIETPYAPGGSVTRTLKCCVVVVSRPAGKKSPGDPHAERSQATFEPPYVIAQVAPGAAQQASVSFAIDGEGVLGEGLLTDQNGQVPPWIEPRVECTSNTSISTTSYVAITGCSITVTPVKNVRAVVTTEWGIQVTGSPGDPFRGTVYLKVGAGAAAAVTNQGYVLVNYADASEVHHCSKQYIFDLTAGVTYVIDMRARLVLNSFGTTYQVNSGNSAISFPIVVGSA